MTTDERGWVMAWRKGCRYLRWMELTSKLARTDIRGL